MKNGITVKLKKKQQTKLIKEYNNTRVKKDMAEKYNLSIPTIEKVITNGRCSERIYKILFKNEK